MQKSSVNNQPKLINKNYKTMKAQLLTIAINNGIMPVLYGESTQSLYEVKFVNQHLVGSIHLAGTSDVVALMRALVEEWLRGQQSKMTQEQHPSAASIFAANERKSVAAIVRCMNVDSLIELYNATHSQQLTITKVK